MHYWHQGNVQNIALEKRPDFTCKTCLFLYVQDDFWSETKQKFRTPSRISMPNWYSSQSECQTASNYANNSTIDLFLNCIMERRITHIHMHMGVFILILHNTCIFLIWKELFDIHILFSCCNIGLKHKLFEIRLAWSC